MNLQILQTLTVCLTVRNLSETSEGYETKPGEPIENETTVVIVPLILIIVPAWIQTTCCN